MVPIVDGLEEQYQDKIKFMRVDANTDEGGETFRFYGLPGHPSYILLNPDGEVLWKGFGEQTATAIDMEIQKHIPQND
jgi:hypothetical protein